MISVSDTRTLETDAGGALVQAMTSEAGFSVVGRDLFPDEPEQLRGRVRELTGAGREAHSGLPEAGAGPSGIPSVDVILVTGGTGVAPRDGTVDAVVPLFERRLDGFGELFRMLSFAEVGSAAMLSRACAGIVAGVAVFLMPGSPPAIRLALQRLILPELGHLISELRRQPAASTTAAPRHEGHHHHGSEHRHRG